MDDLISRQAAIDVVYTCRDTDTIETTNGGTYIDMEQAEEMIEQLPSVTPERPTGRWIEVSSLHHSYKCSECGRLLVNITDGKNNVVKHYPYCHCGCKMEV